MESPDELVARIPLSAAAAAGVARNRAAVDEALRGRAGRFLVLVGPCSIHDPAAALEFGRRLRGLADRLGPGGVLLAMRAYVEKSRTALGWRGLAEEPGIDGRRDPEAGAEAAR
ncbi:MAG: 3-deoxy-7-phosphoheptulonate synthase, partial [Spirochaetaceae bacterium]|nr:3-deoxy-7-phosphoheptulonate synthase [Spirochaetaceae bacterium]